MSRPMAMRDIFLERVRQRFRVPESQFNPGRNPAPEH